MKKERYIFPDSLHAFANKMLSLTAEFRQRESARHLRPDHAALLVLDVQRYFLDPASHAFIPSAPAILSNIGKLIQVFANRGRPVIFTRHTNTPADAGQMRNWWRNLLAPDTPDSAIVPELDTMHGIVLEKHQYDAFYKTELEEILRAQHTEDVVVTGVMTHLCCETTARSAFMRGFRVFFIVDGTATYTEAFHRATVINLAHGFAVLARADEILEVWAR
ncbi:MAG: isochorismatase family protein [Anaerolineales bacterium]